MLSYDFSQTKTSKSVLPCMVATLWLTPGGCSSAKYTINTLGFFRGSTFEMAKTQKNKAIAHHLGLMKAKLAKLRRELLTPTSRGGGGAGEGFDVTKSGDARVVSYEFTTLTCIPGVNTYRGAKIQADNGSSCFDLICPGFVQTSIEVLLGGDIGTYNYGSEIEFQISKDPDTNNWWFLYNSEEVGYWPSDIFQSTKYEANMVQWGGKVFSPYVGTHPHTDTAMGNGKFANRLYRQSGTMTGLLIEENSSPLKRPKSYTISSNEWNCYDADLLDEKVPEPVFLYVGPGSHFNPNC
ncbi:putative neprosin [Helianthus anomalus]